MQFLSKKRKKWQKVSTWWSHYDIKMKSDKIFDIIFEILVQYTLRLVLKMFSYRMIFRVKIGKRKKKVVILPILPYFPFYRFDPRAVTCEKYQKRKNKSCSHDFSFSLWYKDHKKLWYQLLSEKSYGFGFGCTLIDSLKYKVMDHDFQ